MTSDDTLKDWWKRWRAQDFTWEGLKKHAWKGWVVVEGSDGEKYLVEAKTRRRYGAPIPENPDEADVPEDDRAPGDPGPSSSSPGSSGGSMGHPDEPGGDGKQERPANLQDYWRADPVTGRWRNDDEMAAELYWPGKFDGPVPPPSRMSSRPGPPPPLSSRPSPEGAEPGPTAALQEGEMGPGSPAAIGMTVEGTPTPFPPETYHACHLPLDFADGSETPKSEWDDKALDPIVEPRVRSAGETLQNISEIAWRLADRRAQLQGCVLLSSPEHPKGVRQPRWLRCSFAYFFGKADFAGAIFEGDADFRHASFGGFAIFSRASFAGAADFESANFASSASFESTFFIGEADFRSVSVAGDVWFRNSKFQESAILRSAKFSGKAWCHSAFFGRGADFQGAQFLRDAHFQHVNFDGIALFEGASFGGDTWFSRAIVAGDARLQNSTFSGGTDFSETVFRDNTSFRSAYIEGYANFENTVFLGDADFQHASFAAATVFRGSSFATNARFQGTNFETAAALDRAVFAGEVDFSLGTPRAKPAGATTAEGREADGEGAFGKKVAEFAGALTLDHSAFIREQYGFERVSFDDAHFWGPVSFVNRLFRDETSFRRAEFYDGASFHGATLHEKTFFTDRVFHSGYGAAPTTLPEDLPDASRPAFEEALQFRKDEIANRRKDKDARHAAATRLEADFRRLKIEMENLRDRTEEQNFFALEIEARQQRTTGVTPWEKGFAWLFKVTSDYGRRISWPLFWLMGTFGAFFLIYIMVALFTVPIERADGMTGPLTQPESFGHLWNSITRAAAVSLERTAVPVIGQDYDVHVWLKTFATEMPLTATALGLAHRFVATALLFLLVLTIRRRFQIN